MRSIKIITILSFVLSGVMSCSDNNEKPAGEYAKGVFIINEGNFSEANGSVGFYNESSAVVSQDIFEEANGTAVGGLIQSVYFHEERAFIIDQLGNKIYVVDAETFELITTIEEGLSTPRYMVVEDNMAYVTNWGPFDSNYDLPDSYVSVFDLSSFEETSSIKTDNGSEGIIAFGGRVYVANSFSNTIDVIDPTDESVVLQIEVAPGPLGFAEDKTGTIWVISSDYISGSALSQLDLGTEEVLKSFTIGGSAKSLQINGAGDELYYLSAPYGADAAVFKVAISASVNSDNPVLSGANLYGLGVHPITGQLFVANNNGFQGNGTILLYNDSELLDSFAAGVGPNGFVFR